MINYALNISNRYQFTSERFFLFLSTIMVLSFYNIVGYYSSLRHLNYTGVLITTFDKAIPFQDIWVVFYIAIYPVIFLSGLFFWFNKDVTIVSVRACSLTVILMALTCYALFFAFPMSVISVFGVPKALYYHSLLAGLTKKMFSTESRWDANPSMHITVSWIAYRFLTHIYSQKILKYSYIIWFIGMLIGTLTLKVHIIFNIICGILIAELFFRFVFENEVTKKISLKFGTIDRKYKLIFYLLFLFFLLIIFIKTCKHCTGATII